MAAARRSGTEPGGSASRALGTRCPPRQDQARVTEPVSQKMTQCEGALGTKNVPVGLSFRNVATIPAGDAAPSEGRRLAHEDETGGRRPPGARGGWEIAHRRREGARGEAA